ncbi:hypothetical protein GCM10009782_15120 [Glycomyces algeriensis]
MNEDSAAPIPPTGVDEVDCAPRWNSLARAGPAVINDNVIVAATARTSPLRIVEIKRGRLIGLLRNVERS